MSNDTLDKLIPWVDFMREHGIIKLEVDGIAIELGPELEDDEDGDWDVNAD